MAVKVLPEPVAICTKAFGRFSLNDFSNLVIAVTWQSLSPSGCNDGISNTPALNVLASHNQSSNVSGRWNVNTGRERGLGSR